MMFELVQSTTSQLMGVSTWQQQNDASQTATRTIPVLTNMSTYMLSQTLQAGSWQVAEVTIAVLAAVHTPLPHCSTVKRIAGHAAGQNSSLSNSKCQIDIRHNGLHQVMLALAAAGAAGAQLATRQQHQCYSSKQQQQQQGPAELPSAIAPR
jgi:hypothetical protein